jgi:hypothetical protein
LDAFNLKVKELSDSFLIQFNFLLMKKFRLLLLSLAFLAFATSMVDAHDCADTFAGTWYICDPADAYVIMQAVADRCGNGDYLFHFKFLPADLCEPI